jgi:hypothetical protein
MVLKILIVSLCSTALAPIFAFGQQQNSAQRPQGSIQPGQIAQQPPPNNGPEGQEQLPPDKRVFGVLPNYRTADANVPFAPLTPQQKMTIAAKDSFDYPLIGLGAIYAGLYQLTDSHPQFGQGVKGYFHRFGTSYADQAIGNLLAEGILPSAFKEDPRYFRLGKISGKSVKGRVWYAATRIFVTRTDSGARSVNFAELVGTATAAGIGLSYYSDSRNVGDYFQNAGTGLATDAFSQVLKELWPDVKQWYHNRHHEENLASH